METMSYNTMKLTATYSCSENFTVSVLMSQYHFTTDKTYYVCILYEKMNHPNVCY